MYILFNVTLAMLCIHAIALTMSCKYLSGVVEGTGSTCISHHLGSPKMYMQV